MYNFSLKSSRTFIDPVQRYGYWNRKDGSEGGGLWFGPIKGCDQLQLIDYDGCSALPLAVIAEIRALGIYVPQDLEMG
jgi:hypothetical protein